MIILTGGAFEFPALLAGGGLYGVSFTGDFIFSGVESGELGNGA